jgi:hypothetical protein
MFDLVVHNVTAGFERVTDAVKLRIHYRYVTLLLSPRYRMGHEKVARLPFCTVNHYVTSGIPQHD